MKMHGDGPRLPEYPKEVPRRVRQAPSDIRLDGKAFLPHPLAECAKRCHRIDARGVPLLSLPAAHLRNECLGAAHIHAVYYVRNPHKACLNLRQRGTSRASVPGSPRARCLIT